jgi:hypothetical protein
MAAFSSRATTAMRLTKWYLDCIQDDGRCALVYVGSLRWGRTEVNLQSVLHRAHGHSRRAIRLGGPGRPHQTLNALGLDLPAFGLRGSWSPDGASSGPQCDWLGQGGGVSWRCVAPTADVWLQIGSTHLHGRGYVEVLELSVPPWQLPLQRLRWGRFVGTEAHSAAHAIWLQWSGSTSLRWLHVNGVQAPLHLLRDDGWDSAEAHLRQRDACDLQRGPLVGDRLGRVLRHLGAAPRWLAGLDEHKWLAPATLITGPSATRGWVIDETVTFGTPGEPSRGRL